VIACTAIYSLTLGSSVHLLPQWGGEGVCLLFYRNTAAFALFSGFCFIRLSFLLLNNIETKNTIVFLKNIFRRNNALSKVFIFKTLYGILKYLA